MAKKVKKTTDTINSKLALVIKSGKYTLGLKSTLKTLRDGKALIILLSNNIPAVQKSQLEYYSMMSKTNVHYYDGNNNELGTACGRFFPVSVLAITDAGDSDIVQ